MSAVGDKRSASVAIVDLSSSDLGLKTSDLGPRRISAASASRDGMLIGTAEGEIVKVSPSGRTTKVTSTREPIANVAAGKKGLWFITESGSVWWSKEDSVNPTKIGRVKSPKREGGVVVGNALWVLEDKGRIARFTDMGQIAPLKTARGALSLTSCKNGVWVRHASRGDSGTIELLSFGGDVQQSWTPPTFAGYVSCAGEELWAVNVGGDLYRSSR